MFTDKITQTLKGKVKLPYYNVRSCPRCGSRKTGRFVKSAKNRNDNEFTKLSSLKNGEIIELTKQVPEQNAFCTECGFSWSQYICERYVPLEYIENQKRARGTVYLLDELCRQMEEEEKEKSKKYGHLGNTTRKFFGKL